MKYFCPQSLDVSTAVYIVVYTVFLHCLLFQGGTTHRAGWNTRHADFSIRALSVYTGQIRFWPLEEVFARFRALV